MLDSSRAFNSFAVNDTQRAREFYSDVLGVEVETIEPEMGLLMLRLPGDQQTMIYEKPDFEPATYTVLNFQVDDVEATVDQLVNAGLQMERYDGFDQDDKGIASGPGPGRIAWFKDPAGNILAVLEQR